MARTISLPHFFQRSRQDDDMEMMEALTVSVNENFFTFRGWIHPGVSVKKGGTLTEKICGNFATFRQWNQ